MRADSLRPRWMSLLWAAALLTAGCASLMPPPGGERTLRYTPRGDAEPMLAEGPGQEPPRALASPPPSMAEPKEPERLHRRQELRQEVTSVRPGSEAGAVGGALSRGAAEPEQQSAALTHQAVLSAINEVLGSTRGIAGALPPLASPRTGLSGQANDAFTPHVAYGDAQLQWIHDALGGANTLASAASEIHEPDMEQALLRLSGPRLQAAMFGSLLLATWVDFLSLANAVLRQSPYYSVEKLYVEMDRVRRRIEPAMRALASLEPGQVEEAAAGMPELMGELTREFHSIREDARAATEEVGQIVAVAQFVEMLGMLSMMRVTMPRLPPAAPALSGVGLVMGSGGVMMGTRLVVTAEWVEMMRRLVQAGVLSVPVASAAVRIHAGQVMMSQAHQELPRGVREALGEGPEVGGMHATGKAGAGMAERPQHHVLPDEYREWFEKRGFKGAMSIDEFCVELETATHQAIHGGGNWRLGRTWPGEWNQMIMKALREAEEEAGRMLTRSEILKVIATEMKRYSIPMNFTRWRGR